jgi:hypothetical protein
MEDMHMVAVQRKPYGLIDFGADERVNDYTYQTIANACGDDIAIAQWFDHIYLGRSLMGFILLAGNGDFRGSHANAVTGLAAIQTCSQVWRDRQNVFTTLKAKI